MKTKEERIADYEARRAAKAERYAELASKNKKACQDSARAFHEHLHMMPLGQPILIGHHSEKRHRAHIRKTDAILSKCSDYNSKAGYYANKAANAESSRVIFSDDPAATDKLKEKIGRAEKSHEMMKQANAAIKKAKGDSDKAFSLLVEIGFKEEDAKSVLTPDFLGRTGFASYSIQNSNANIRRMKKRLESLQIKEEHENTEETFGDIRIVQDYEANRTRLYFPGIPSLETRTFLKTQGFRWARYEKCWQRHLSEYAEHLAKKAAEIEQA